MTDTTSDRNHEHTIVKFGAEEIRCSKSSAALRGGVFAILASLAFIYWGGSAWPDGDLFVRLCGSIFLVAGISFFSMGFRETRAYLRVRIFCVIRKMGEIEIHEDSGRVVRGRLVRLRTTTNHGINTDDFPLYRLYAVVNTPGHPDEGYVLLFQRQRHQSDRVDCVAKQIASFAGVSWDKVGLGGV